MIQWQARAQSVTGAVMVFGLEAPDADEAREKAMQRLPFDPHTLSVTYVTPRGER